MSSTREPFYVVDIGNSRIKYARADFAQSPGDLALKHVRWADEFDIPVESESESCEWFVASVSRPGLQRFQQWVEQRRPQDRVIEISYRDFELEYDVDYPEKTGIDRFCAAAAAIEWTRKRRQPLPAIVVDIGTAVTVDVVNEQGVFLGGTIFIGPLKALQELSERTDALPDVSDLNIDESFSPIGKNTRDALIAGALLSLVGGIKEIAERQMSRLSMEAVVVLTGGGAPYIRKWIPENWTIVDELVLQGIHLAAINKKSPQQGS